MHGLYDVWGVDYPPDLSGILEILTEMLPIPVPRLDDNRIFLTPFVLQGIQDQFSRFLGVGPVTLLEIRYKGLLVLIAHILQSVAYPMDPT